MLRSTRGVLSSAMGAAAFLGAWLVPAPTDAQQEDRALDRPYFWYVITSRGTTSGDTQEYTYVLWPDVASPDGYITKADGMGGTQWFRVLTLSGPLSWLSEVCTVEAVPGETRASVGCTFAAPGEQTAPAYTEGEQGKLPTRDANKGLENLIKLVLWGGAAIFALALIAAGGSTAAPMAAPASVIMVDSPPADPASPLDATQNVDPTYLTTWPEQAESELFIFLDEYLRALGDTALGFFDETDMRKVGTGVGEVLNILDRLEADAERGRLTGAQVAAGIVDAFKQVGLDVVRAASLVSALRAMGHLGAAGVRALRNRLVGESKAVASAVKAGVAAEEKLTEEVLKRGGRNLNNHEELGKEIGQQLKVRGGKGKFPVVDVVDETGAYTSIATSQQATPRYLKAKYKVLFEGAGSQHTHQ